MSIWASLLNRPDVPARDSADDEANASIRRWRTLVEPLLDEHAVRLHRRFNAMRFAAVELGRRADSEPRGDDSLFVSHLIDLVAALLDAP